MTWRLVAGALGMTVLVSACTSAQSDPEPTPAVTPVATAESSSGVEPDLESFYAQTLDWQGCDQGECATLEVPLDYDDPQGPTIEVAVLRSPATDQANRLGSLVVNPGGPGASGVEYAARADSIVTPRLREFYDIVGFDPRGVGQSTPLECVTDEQVDESLNESDPTPDTPEEVDELLAGAAEFLAGCQRTSADLLPHVGTQDVARDLDVLRAALGDDRLSYLGRSYGTSIGAEYARLFDDRVGRLVLDGALPPGLSERDVLLGQAEGFEQALTSFAADCVEGSCSLGTTQAEVLEAVDRVLSAADDQPIATSSRPLSLSLATYGILLPLYWTPDQGYPPLEAALAQALGGDGSGLLQLADTYLGRSPDGTFPGNQWDVFTPVACLDRPGSATPDEVVAQLPEFEAASPRFGESLAWGLISCTDWPATSDGLPAPVEASDAPPILVVGTVGDPATPYEWAVDLAGQLDSGVLLGFEGAHLAYLRGSECVDAAVDDYLIEGTVPADGTRCT